MNHRHYTPVERTNPRIKNGREFVDIACTRHECGKIFPIAVGKLDALEGKKQYPECRDCREAHQRRLNSPFMPILRQLTGGKTRV